MTMNTPSCGIIITVHPYSGPAIHRVPEEILVYIFTLYSEGIALCQRSFECRVKPPRSHACDWMPLMLVCRRWREVGRSYPSLWQAIDVENNMQWLQLALDRSQGVTLELRFHSLTIALSSESMALLSPQFHRMRKLLLPRVTRADVPALHALLSTDMPVLKELGVWADKNDDFAAARTQTVAAPVTIFYPQHYPNLRRLRLSCMKFPWERSAVSHLQFLHLHGCHSLDPVLPFERFLHVLADCPKLEELRLHHFISTTSWHIVPAEFKYEVSLPRLRKLVVGDVPPLIGLFLSHVSHSRLVTLRLIGWIDPPFTNDTPPLLLSMLPQDRRRLPILSTATKVTFHGSEGIDIRGTSPGASITLKLDSPTTDLTGYYMDRSLLQLRLIFKKAPIKELDIYCGHDVRTPAVWRGLFASLPELRLLDVAPGHLVRPIWHALGGRSFALREDAAHALCPALRDVRMDYLQWEDDAMDYILASLRRRAMRGLPRLDFLQLMFIADCDTQKDDIDDMMLFYDDHIDTYVDDFSWDFAL